jgi:hypothetical protein
LASGLGSGAASATVAMAQMSARQTKSFNMFELKQDQGHEISFWANCLT